MASSSSSEAGSAAKDHSYDAIVIGTGITGGWAAKELTEKGLKTLVLDRGRDVKHGDYPTAAKDLWEFPYGGRATDEDLQRQVVCSKRELECGDKRESAREQCRSAFPDEQRDDHRQHEHQENAVIPEHRLEREAQGVSHRDRQRRQRIPGRCGGQER